MFTLYSSFLSLIVIGSLSYSQAANNTTPGTPHSAVPQCAANCMSIKITEAASWFGAANVQTYCQHPEFLDAYNKCLGDHCEGNDLIVGKEAGIQTCAGTTPAAGSAPATSTTGPKDPTTAHTPPLSGPAGTPDNSTLTASKNVTNATTPNGGNSTNLNGALPPTTAPISNSLGSNTSNGARFSGAVGSAAANASSQAGAATAISCSSAIMFTALSSCLLSLVI